MNTPQTEKYMTRYTNTHSQFGLQNWWSKLRVTRYV